MTMTATIHSRQVWGFALAMGLFIPIAASAQQSCRAAGKLMPVEGLPEASGVAASRKSAGVLWSHNDSGEPVIVAVGTDGATKGRVRVAGASVSDWEDIDVGPCPGGSCVYIGDIGDNNAKRGSITIYRVPEPEPGVASSTNAESMRLTYPDGARDAEALIVLPDGAMLVVSKGEKSSVGVYRVAAFRDGGTARMENVATIAAGKGSAGVARENRITGGSASRDGRWIALRSLSSLAFYDASELGAGKVREVFRSDVSGVGEPQGEGVSFGDDGTMWLSSEGGGKSKPGAIAKLTCQLK